MSHKALLDRYLTSTNGASTCRRASSRRYERKHLNWELFCSKITILEVGRMNGQKDYR